MTPRVSLINPPARFSATTAHISHFSEPDFFFSIYILTDVFVHAPSHDFIGDFTTSYRELARGQSQFNVYEVSGSHFNTHCASHHISATGDVSVSDISIVLMLRHISLYMDIFLI